MRINIKSNPSESKLKLILLRGKMSRCSQIEGMRVKWSDDIMERNVCIPKYPSVDDLASSLPFNLIIRILENTTTKCTQLYLLIFQKRWWSINQEYYRLSLVCVTNGQMQLKWYSSMGREDKEFYQKRGKRIKIKGKRKERGRPERSQPGTTQKYSKGKIVEETGEERREERNELHVNGEIFFSK